LLSFFYGFFLSMSKPTIAIAMIMAIAAATIPMVRPDIVATLDTGVAVGTGVDGGLLA
jgi:high-affinity nickel permease